MLAHAGLPSDTILSPLGIVSGDVRSNDSWFEREVFAELWREIDLRTRDPLVGLHGAEAVPHHTFVLNFIAESCSDLAEAIEKTERYLPLVAPTMRMFRRRARGQVGLLFEVREDAEDQYPHHVFDFAITCAFLGLRNASSVQWNTERFQARRTRPAGSRAEYGRVYGGRPQFQCDLDGFWIDAELLALPMKRPNPHLLAILTAHADHLLTLVPDASSLPRRAREVLTDELRGGDASLKRLAAVLGLSTRSLQRRLSETGTTFSELLDETRCDAAVRYLNTESLSLDAIATLLGYGGHSSFDRAFRRWTGSSASRFRRRS